VAFVRLDGGYVAVVKASKGGTFHVRDLPAGTYGISYATRGRKGFQAPDVALIPGEILTATIPAAGVITIYSKPRQPGPVTYPFPPGVSTYGCGLNPAGSLTITGDSSPGGRLNFHLDNPLGTQHPGSSTMLLISSRPDPLYPCGTLVPGLGMSGPGAPGEFLVQEGSAMLLFLDGPNWRGTGRPSTISVAIPPRIQWHATAFAQGLFHDPAGPVEWGLTNALQVEIGFHSAR
jgi:hypothetical protein